MKEEDKLELLRKFICGGVKYKVQRSEEIRSVKEIKIDGDSFLVDGLHLDQITPLYRPLTSMTDEESSEWCDTFMQPIVDLEQYLDEPEDIQHMKAVELYTKAHKLSLEWLDKHNFDLR